MLISSTDHYIHTQDAHTYLPFLDDEASTSWDPGFFLNNGGEPGSLTVANSPLRYKHLNSISVGDEFLDIDPSDAQAQQSAASPRSSKFPAFCSSNRSKTLPRALNKEDSWSARFLLDATIITFIWVGNLVLEAQHERTASSSLVSLFGRDKSKIWIRTRRSCALAIGYSESKRDSQADQRALR